MSALRRNTCKRKQSGGALGSTYGFAPAAVSGANNINNPLVYATDSSCRAATPPGFIKDYGQGLGLPGFPLSGGRRKGSRKNKRKGKASRKNKKRRSQKGGAYGFNMPDGTVYGPAGGLANMTSLGCSGPSSSSIPDSGAAGSLNSQKSYLWEAQKGGALHGGLPGAPLDYSMSGGQLGANSLAVTAPTAGYSHLTGPTSVIGTSTGTNVMVNNPANARAMNQECLKTGGGRSRKNKSKKSKKSKKTKKSKSN